MASPAQKAAQARLSKASKQASAAGLKGAAFRARVKSLLKGTGGRTKAAGGRAKTAGNPPRARAAAARAKTGVKHAAKGLIATASPKRVVTAALVIDGAIESFRNAQRTWPTPGTRAQQIIMPLADSVLAAKTFHKAASSSVTSPGLIADLWNWRPFGKTPDLTLRRGINALPSGTGWWLAIQRYREIRRVENRVVHENLLPRLSSMIGIRIRNARAIGGPWLAGAGAQNRGGTTRELGNALLDGPATMVGIGAAGSKLIAKAHVF